MRRSTHIAAAAVLLLLAGGAALAEESLAAGAGGMLIERMPWPVGEKLTYRLYWGVVRVGTITATTEWVDYEGRRLVAIRFVSVSNKVLAKIYPVDDLVESLVDPSTLLPVRFTKRLNEGKYHTDEVTVFDHARGVAQWTSRLKGKTKQFPINAETRDIPSFMYYMRSRRYTPGDRQYHELMADDKLYDMWLTVLRTEPLKVSRFGEMETVRIQPEASFEGLFVRRGGMDFWLSQDARGLAVRITLDIPVGSVRAVIDRVEGLGADRWVSLSGAAAPAEEDPAGAPGDGGAP